MLTNLHTHTTFCDGKNTPEEVVLAAIDRGFASIGFSGHGYTPFDPRYCLQDTTGYIAEIKRLRAAYAGKISIYLGVEEDAFAPVMRTDFDYIIGSSHYLRVDGQFYPIDSSPAHFARCLDVFGGDAEKLADAYYRSFCAYIGERRPDIVGHFDLITKYEETGEPHFFCSEQYLALAERYLLRALEADVIFEVNTGAIARGLRTSPYPHERLLHRICRSGGKITLSSDCHRAELLDAAFAETEQLLREIGFAQVYVLDEGKFKPISL